jgi:hypothetical protein
MLLNGLSTHQWATGLGRRKPPPSALYSDAARFSSDASRALAYPAPKSVADVARRALDQFADVVHGSAVTIFTPPVKKVPLHKQGLKPELEKFICLYERTANRGGWPLPTSG